MNRVRRRTMITAVAATLAPIVGSPVAESAAANPDASLFALCTKLSETMRAYLALDHELEDPDREPVEFNAYLAARDEVIETKPQTMAGVMAKARATLADMHFYGWDGDEDNPEDCSTVLAWSVLFDVLRVGEVKPEKGQLHLAIEDCD